MDKTIDLDQPAARDWTDGEEAALRMWVALGRCYSTLGKAVASKVQESGLTMPQFGTLEALYHLGPMSLGDLAEKLLVTGGNVTYVMDRLEDQGLVRRYRDPNDRRIIQAKLTTEGHAVIAEAFPRQAAHLEHVSRHLTPEEQETLRELLKRLGIGIASHDL